MQTFLSIVITVLMFGLLIFIHELGHFLVAKWSRVKINEFALGMGPRIFSKQGKVTLYSLRLFPIGGFVQMDGEDGNGTDENSFNKKPKWKRFLILVAGAFNNLLFGFLLICLVNGVLSKSNEYPTTTIRGFYEKSTSDDHGLASGDEIYEIDGYRIYTYMDIGYACGRKGTEPLGFTVIRNGEKKLIENVSFPINKDTSTGDYFLVDFVVFGKEKNFFSTIEYSFDTSVALSRSIYSFFGSIFTGNANLNNVSGVVGTTVVVGETVTTDQGINFTTLFLMIAMISINLGIVNLLPFPALDGGRVVLLAYEAIFGKKLSEKVEVAINAIGFILLMLLMVFIVIKDVVQLF